MEQKKAEVVAPVKARTGAAAVAAAAEQDRSAIKLNAEVKLDAQSDSSAAGKAAG